MMHYSRWFACLYCFFIVRITNQSGPVNNIEHSEHKGKVYFAFPVYFYGYFSGRCELNWIGRCHAVHLLRYLSKSSFEFVSL